MLTAAFRPEPLPGRSTRHPTVSPGVTAASASQLPWPWPPAPRADHQNLRIGENRSAGSIPVRLRSLAFEQEKQVEECAQNQSPPDSLGKKVLARFWSLHAQGRTHLLQGLPVVGHGQQGKGVLEAQDVHAVGRRGPWAIQLTREMGVGGERKGAETQIDLHSAARSIPVSKGIHGKATDLARSRSDELEPQTREVGRGVSLGLPVGIRALGGPVTHLLAKKAGRNGRGPLARTTAACDPLPRSRRPQVGGGVRHRPCVPPRSACPHPRDGCSGGRHQVRA